MSVAASKGRFQVALACLLVLCLSPAAMTTQWLCGREDSGAGSETVLFTHVFASRATSAISGGTRARFDGFDDRFKAAVISGQTPIVFARKSSSSLSDYGASVSHCTDRTAIPIRAPPRRHCR